MNPYRRALDFLKHHAWTLIEQRELGTTAHILIIERGGERAALKVLRDEQAQVSALRREYEVLRYLMTTAMRRCAPNVGEWLRDLDGFLMEYLRAPTLAEQQATAWAPNVARTLSALHSIGLPSGEIVDDDRPDIGAAMCHRFQTVFQTVLESERFWANLSSKDTALLGYVRSRHDIYSSLLPLLQEALLRAPAALTHGDLSGDNIMVTQDGQIVFTDWGAARISAAASDVAYLLTYTNWPEETIQQFLQVYYNYDRSVLEGMASCLSILSQLYHYRSCVQSLLWLNDEQTGLDAVGRAHFERLVGALP